VSTSTGRLSALSTLTIAVVAGVLALAPALPAAAHGGEIELQVVHDGAGGITVLPTFEADGHPVQDIIDPVLTATSSSGKSVGPVSLVSASEGVGNWETAEPVLDDGSWTVTVAITEPSEATETIDVEVVPLAEPIDNSTTGEDVAVADSDQAASGVLVPLLAGVLALLVVAGAVLLVLRRRSATAQKGGR
jgi:hypothetical protein